MRRTPIAAPLVRQVVIVAAGLDARAFRLPLSPDTTVFEIDRNDVLDVKETLVNQARLAPRCSRVTVVADILDPEWISGLADRGWDPGRSTLWILEGLLIYLGHDERVRLLSQLSTASNGGRLGVSLSTETASMRHPLWRPAVEDDPEIWMSSSGWHARTETMAEASASFGRPLPASANASRSWRLVSATAAGRR
jgi:methyltransferase (TIGR00027 family)